MKDRLEIIKDQLENALEENAKTTPDNQLIYDYVSESLHNVKALIDPESAKWMWYNESSSLSWPLEIGAYKVVLKDGTVTKNVWNGFGWAVNGVVDKYLMDE